MTTLWTEIQTVLHALDPTAVQPYLSSEHLQLRRTRVSSPKAVFRLLQKLPAEYYGPILQRCYCFGVLSALSCVRLILLHSKRNALLLQCFKTVCQNESATTLQEILNRLSQRISAETIEQVVEAFDAPVDLSDLAAMLVQLGQLRRLLVLTTAKTPYRIPAPTTPMPHDCQRFCAFLRQYDALGLSRDFVTLVYLDRTLRRAIRYGLPVSNAELAVLKMEKALVARLRTYH